MKDTNNGLHSYKEYNKEYIGSSDYSSLILVGCENGVKTFALNFGEDSNYYAYIVDNKAHIGSHYMKVAEFTAWLKMDLFIGLRRMLFGYIELVRWDASFS